MATIKLSLSVLCVTSIAVTLGVASPALASEQNTVKAALAESNIETVNLIERVTGIDDIVEVAPGESSDSVTVPESADDPVKLSAAGVDIQFTAPGESKQTIVSDDGTISYLSEDQAFNTHLQVLASPDPEVLSEGVRSLIEIEDASAPHEYEYPVELEPGTTLSVQPDGTVVGALEDETVLVVPAPWALDAAGAKVETWYEVRGDSIIQHINFSAANAFPVIADPVWFVPLVVAGARVIGQVAISAATRAAAVQSTLVYLRQQILGLSASRWSHIMAPKHNWSRLASSRTEVADLMSRAVVNGAQVRGPGYFDYVWTHRGQTIVVRTSLQGHISNGWIRP